MNHVARLALVLALALVFASGAARGVAQEGGKPAAPPQKPEVVVSLDSLDLASVDQSWGSAHAGTSVEGHPITIAGKVYAHGVGTHATSEMHVQLGGAAASFTADVGVDDEPCGGVGTVVFSVLVDGKELARTPVVKKGEPARHLEVDLTGARELTLVVEDGGDNINFDHADWAAAAIRMAPGAKTLPTTLRVDEVPLEICTKVDPAPHVNHPRIIGSTPGKPFLFRIPASGAAPLTFSAAGLPAGLALDAASGVISGTLASDARTDVKVTAANAQGRETRTLTIVGGPAAVALTPPMGWNSWNCWALAVDDAKVRAAADAFVNSGLAAHGYAFVNIDDGWEQGRGKDGRILANQNFPHMKGLADYVHAKGLKLGIYSSPGPRTCGGYEGSWQHEQDDADRWADWGVDYLKYDWCSYGDLAPNPDHAALVKPYALMQMWLRAAPRDVVFSLCQYGMGKVWEWGRDVDGNCWRTTGDIGDSWGSMAGIGFAQIEIASHGGPGHWNDPDMLVVGQVGWGPTLHPTHLTRNEQITHITLWSMLAAPLLLGCDLRQLDEFTLALITNDDVLAVDQDRLGKAAHLIANAAQPAAKAAQTVVWARPLADGTTAVALFNRSRAPAAVTVTWQELGMSGPQPVRDCWLRRDLGPQADALRVELPRHGAALLRVGKIGE
jgi:alpha-galactosidase